MGACARCTERCSPEGDLSCFSKKKKWQRQNESERAAAKKNPQVAQIRVRMTQFALIRVRKDPQFCVCLV